MSVAKGALCPAKRIGSEWHNQPKTTYHSLPKSSRLHVNVWALKYGWRIVWGRTPWMLRACSECEQLFCRIFKSGFLLCHEIFRIELLLMKTFILFQFKAKPCTLSWTTIILNKHVTHSATMNNAFFQLIKWVTCWIWCITSGLVFILIRQAGTRGKQYLNCFSEIMRAFEAKHTKFSELEAPVQTVCKPYS